MKPKDLDSATVLSIMGWGIAMLGVLHILTKYKPYVTLIIGAVLIILSFLVEKAQKKYGLDETSKDIIHGRKLKK